IGSPSAFATSAMRIAWPRSTSGYTTGSKQRSPAARFCLGASSRSTDIDLHISIEVTLVNRYVCVPHCARRAGTIVAAGRAVLPQLAASSVAPYLSLLGDARGAELHLAPRRRRFRALKRAGGYVA